MTDDYTTEQISAARALFGYHMCAPRSEYDPMDFCYTHDQRRTWCAEYQESIFARIAAHDAELRAEIAAQIRAAEVEYRETHTLGFLGIWGLAATIAEGKP